MLRRTGSILPISLAVAAIALIAIGIGFAATERSHQQAALDSALHDEASAERAVLSNYFAQARAINLLVARQPAMAAFYSLPGSRLERVHRGGRVIDEIKQAFQEIQRLYPTSISESCFIDAGGPENARVVRGSPATVKDLSPNERGNPFFGPTFALDVGQVYQAAPYVSPDTHEWVISNSTPLPTPDGAKHAIVHFEIRLESFRRAAAAASPKYPIAIVDARTGRIVVDSAYPQRVGAPLGRPADHRFGSLVRQGRSEATATLGGHRSSYVHLVPTAHNANDWYVVATDPKPVAAWYQGLEALPLGLLGAAFLLLGLTVFAYRRVRTAEARAVQEEAARRSERRFRALVDNSSDVILTVDARGAVDSASGAARQVLGRPAEDLLGGQLASVFHADDVSAVVSVLGAGAEDEAVTTKQEWRFQHGDGSWRYADVAVTNLLHAQDVGAVVVNIRDATDRKALEQQLTHQAFHDSLTTLPNRALFRDRLEHALRRRRKRSEPRVAVLFIDLDNFKNVNDSLGHSAGDALLVEVSERLGSCIRPQDTAARFGGDEFAILLDDITSVHISQEVAERVLAAFAKSFVIAGSTVYLTASIGVALAAKDADSVLRNADLAMYAAKHGGKGRFQYFEPEMQTAVTERVKLEAELRTAIDEGQFTLAYQPIIALPAQDITGFEALIRWRHPTRGLVPPADFIPAAEESGLIIPIGTWVLREACRQTTAWRAIGPSRASLKVSVNVAPRQLQQDNFVDVVMGALTDAKLDVEALIIEITEGTVIQDYDRTVASLIALRERGVQVALDDFGIGYSSIGYLRSLPLDLVKIDKSFVSELQDGGKLFQTLLTLNQTLDLPVVAEGIEIAEHVAQMNAFHCEYAQGFYFSQPLDSNSVGTLLRAPDAQRREIA